jgi:hypothetical protein
MFLICLHKQCSYTLYYGILLEQSARFNAFGGKGRVSDHPSSTHDRLEAVYVRELERRAVILRRSFFVETHNAHDHKFPLWTITQ